MGINGDSSSNDLLFSTIRTWGNQLDSYHTDLHGMADWDRGVPMLTLTLVGNRLFKSLL